MATLKRKHNITEYTFLNLYDHTFHKARALAVDKNKEYGNSFAKCGSTGCIIRTMDKIDRYINVKTHSITINEKLEDDLLDCINYLVYAYFLIHHKNEIEVIDENGNEKEDDGEGSENAEEGESTQDYY